MNYGTDYIERCLEKKNGGVYKTIATSKMELLVALASDFQSLTNATNNSILAVAGFLEPLLEHCFEICASVQIK